MVLLGKRIKELRNKYKLTQTELAERIGVTLSSVASYENNSRQPSYEVLIKMSNVFKVSIDSLLLNRSQDIIDVTGLNPEHIEHIQNLVNYYKNEDIIEIFCHQNPAELRNLIKFKENHPEIFKNMEEIVYIINGNTT